MIITVKRGSDPVAVRQALVAHGLWAERFDDVDARFYVTPASAAVDPELIRSIEGVASVATQQTPTPRLDAMSNVEVSGLRVGPGERPVFMAGPCSIESFDQIERIAGAVAAGGAHFLRGGAFKPRTSPYSFQGVGADALLWMRRAADRHGLRVVTEAMGLEEASAVAEVADLIQVGSRNMHNYSLLKGLGAYGRPILLKRGMSATVEEWLAAGEYCLLAGAPGVIFCERGIRAYEPTSRNLLDLNSVAVLAHAHRVPVIVDPSHAAGRRDLIPHLGRAAMALGAHGLMIEVHDQPRDARSDGPQALPPAEAADLFGGVS